MHWLKRAVCVSTLTILGLVEAPSPAFAEKGGGNCFYCQGGQNQYGEEVHMDVWFFGYNTYHGGMHGYAESPGSCMIHAMYLGN